MNIVLYPDPILRRRAAALGKIDEEVRRKVREMFEVMYLERGIGLAAPQVAWSTRLFIVNIECDPEAGEEHVYINPKIIHTEGEMIDEEGCLSIPGVRADVARGQKVVVRAQGLDGTTFEEEIEDLHARVVQHELDHLDGILFIQRLGSADKLSIRDKLKQLAKDRAEGSEGPSSSPSSPR